MERAPRPAPGPSMPGWIYLGHVGDAQPRLVFQPVPETRRDKVCPHLDVAVDDITTGITQVSPSAAGRRASATSRRKGSS
ncbi:hypothetical protein STTU_4662 [Streptomyces sp. Tu6071]|nr:hypothetical protein STTU_4662 [Streptomyces sp. Tu6071]